jgi:hypothetical protein
VLQQSRADFAGCRLSTPSGRCPPPSTNTAYDSKPDAFYPPMLHDDEAVLSLSHWRSFNPKPDRHGYSAGDLVTSWIACNRNGAIAVSDKTCLRDFGSTGGSEVAGAGAGVAG